MSWDRYVESFHAERPGITEAVLRRACADGTDPYDWLAEVVPPRGRVLDLGCGSAPLFRALEGRSWIGLDMSGTPAARRRLTRGYLWFLTLLHYEMPVPLRRVTAERA